MCQFLLFARCDCSTHVFQYLTSFASDYYGALSISLFFIRPVGESTQQMFCKIQKKKLQTTNRSFLAGKLKSIMKKCQQKIRMRINLLCWHIFILQSGMCSYEKATTIITYCDVIEKII